MGKWPNTGTHETVLRNQSNLRNSKGSKHYMISLQHIIARMQR